MHPRTTELLAHLDATRGELLAALDAAPSQLYAKKPGPDAWSVAEIFEHLAIVEARLGELLGAALAKATAAGPLPADIETSSILATLDGERIRDREQRLAARTNVQPSGSVTVAVSLAALDRSRGALRALTLAADGLDTRSVCAPHPYFGELTLHQWIAFLGLHEARHAAQVRAVIAELQ